MTGLISIRLLLRRTPDPVSVFSAFGSKGVRETLWKEVGDHDSGQARR